MRQARQKAVRKTFTMSETDAALLEEIVKRCGYLSESEAVRTLIRNAYASTCTQHGGK
jgi:Arc/MetJ-type ribon-helix-helix transcriptional regulator